MPDFRPILVGIDARLRQLNPKYESHRNIAYLSLLSGQVCPSNRDKWPANPELTHADLKWWRPKHTEFCKA